MENIAMRIMDSREACGLSVEDVADSVRLSVEDYILYESGGKDIPISVLYELAFLFKVDMTDLLAGVSPRMDGHCLVRSGKGLAVERYSGYKYHSLAYNYIKRAMEPLLVLVDPPGEGKAAGLVTHKGQEFNYVVEGRVRITIGDKSYVLNTGDSMYFDPTIPHGQEAVGGKAAFLTVIME